MNGGGDAGIVGRGRVQRVRHGRSIRSTTSKEYGKKSEGSMGMGVGFTGSPSGPRLKTNNASPGCRGTPTSTEKPPSQRTLGLGPTAQLEFQGVRAR